MGVARDFHMGAARTMGLERPRMHSPLQRVADDEARAATRGDYDSIFFLCLFVGSIRMLKAARAGKQDEEERQCSAMPAMLSLDYALGRGHHAVGNCSWCTPKGNTYTYLYVSALAADVRERRV